MNGLQQQSALTHAVPGCLVCPAAVSEQTSPCQRLSPPPRDCGRGSRASVPLAMGCPSQVAPWESWAAQEGGVQLQMDSLRAWGGKELCWYLETPVVRRDVWL